MFDDIENLSEIEIKTLLKSISGSKAFYNSIIKYGHRFKFILGSTDDFEWTGGAWLFDDKHFIKILECFPNDKEGNYSWVNSVSKYKGEHNSFRDAYKSIIRDKRLNEILNER